MIGAVIDSFYAYALSLPTWVYAATFLLFTGYLTVGIASDISGGYLRIGLGLFELLGGGVVYFQAVYPPQSLTEELTLWGGLIYLPLFGSALGVLLRRYFRTEVNALLLSVMREEREEEERDRLGVDSGESLLWALERDDGSGGEP